MNKKEIETFINANKLFVGFGNFTTAFKYPKALDNAHAQIEVAEIAQQLIVSIPSKFFSFHEKMQINILLHELCHGRELMRQHRVEKYTEVIKEEEEEKCINDITCLAEKWEK